MGREHRWPMLPALSKKNCEAVTSGTFWRSREKDVRSPLPPGLRQDHIHLSFNFLISTPLIITFDKISSSGTLLRTVQSNTRTRASSGHTTKTMAFHSLSPAQCTRN